MNNHMKWGKSINRRTKIGAENFSDKKVIYK